MEPLGIHRHLVSDGLDSNQHYGSCNPTREHEGDTPSMTRSSGVCTNKVRPGYGHTRPRTWMILLFRHRQAMGASGSQGHLPTKMMLEPPRTPHQWKTCHLFSLARADPGVRAVWHRDSSRPIPYTFCPAATASPEEGIWRPRTGRPRWTGDNTLGFTSPGSLTCQTSAYPTPGGP